MDTLRADLRYAIRQLARNPGFALVTILTLAVGIGASSSIFSVLNSVLIRPLPFHEPERLVQIWDTNAEVVQERNLGYTDFGVNVLNYDEYRAQNTTFSEMGFVIQYADDGKIRVSGGSGIPEEVFAWGVSSSLFTVLGVQPMMGRTFLDEERAPPGIFRWTEVAILSHDLWQRRFDADPEIVGKTIRLDGAPATVIGVMPPGFDVPPVARRGVVGSRHADVYLPLFYQAYQQPRRFRQLQVLGRLAPGVSREAAQAEMTMLAQRLEEAYPDAMAGYTVVVTPLKALLADGYSGGLYLLMGVVVLVLLVACANVANLLIARGTTRTTEMAVRAAIGGGRGRLVRLLLTETLVLSVLGGGTGLLLSMWGTKVLVRMIPANIPRVVEAGVDGRVLLFTLAVSLLTGVLFGLLPALRGSRVDLVTDLKSGMAGGAGGRSAGFASRLLVAGQVSVAMMLLIGAGMLMKSFLSLQRSDPGFDTRNMLVAEVEVGAHDPLGSDYQRRTPEETAARTRRQLQFTFGALQGIRTLPGVEAVSSASSLPMSDEAGFWPLNPSDRRDEENWALGTHVSPDYFRTMRIPIVRGTGLPAWDGVNEADRVHWAGGCPGAEQYCVVVISEALAASLWPGEDPIGKRVGVYDCCVTVVGVVANVSFRGVDDTPLARDFDTKRHFYLPWLGYKFLVRSTDDPRALIAPVRQVISGLAPEGVVRFTTLDDVLAGSLARPRFYMTLIGLFAVVAVALALVGLYGVVAYGVARRTREIGLRMALGADARAVLSLVIRQEMVPVALGVLLGVVGASMLATVLSGYLYGMEAVDPIVWVVLGTSMAVVALLAAYLPARRASDVSPMEALRSE